MVLAAAATSVTGRPAAIACRTMSSMVAVEPAMAPDVPVWLARRATPPDTFTRIEPSR